MTRGQRSVEGFHGLRRGGGTGLVVVDVGLQDYVVGQAWWSR